MCLLSYTKSIQGVPRGSGFIWVKARNSADQEVTVWAIHSCNVCEALRLANKNEWLRDDDLTDYWVEVLLDKDVLLSA